MSDVKQLALEAFEVREKKLKERKKFHGKNKTIEDKTIEDYVEDIIKIFELSNSSKHSSLIWQVILEGNTFGCSKDGFSPILFSFEQNPKALICNLGMNNMELELYKEEVPELRYMITILRIPYTLVGEVCDYFTENLSEYFEVTEGESYFNYRRIILKNGEII